MIYRLRPSRLFLLQVEAGKEEVSFPSFRQKAGPDDLPRSQLAPKAVCSFADWFRERRDEDDRLLLFTRLLIFVFLSLFFLKR